MFKPTTLYIKTHNLTKLKYFGKTTQDPYTYKGSGTVWLRHLKKYGEDISTEILGFFTDEDSCKKAAMEFSVKNKIVESKEWANLKYETGNDGGDTSATEGFKKWLPKLSEYGKTCRWWNNGVTQTFRPNPPDESFTLGRLKFNNIGAIIGANKQKEKIWVNNGTKEIMVLPTNIPENFQIGRLSIKAFAGGKGRHSAKGSHWWNNGIQNKMAVNSPGLGWVKGRLFKPTQIR